MQLRRTAAQWTADDPVLAATALGQETDTLRVKLGDGISTWNELTYNNTIFVDNNGYIIATARSSGAAQAALRGLLGTHPPAQRLPLASGISSFGSSVVTTSITGIGVRITGHAGFFTGTATMVAAGVLKKFGAGSAAVVASVTGTGIVAVSSGSGAAFVSVAAGSATGTIGNTGSRTVTAVIGGTGVVAITMDSAALYPSTTLYPSAVLFPVGINSLTAAAAITGASGPVATSTTGTPLVVTATRTGTSAVGLFKGGTGLTTAAVIAGSGIVAISRSGAALTATATRTGIGAGAGIGARTTTATITGAGTISALALSRTGIAVTATATIAGAGGLSAVSAARTTTATITGAGFVSVFVASFGTPQLAADTATGKHLVFPSATTYTVASLTIPASCYVDGNNSTLKFGNNTTINTTTSDEILKVNGSNVTIDNLNFDGNSANQSGIYSPNRHCIRIQGAYSNVEVKTCDLTNLIGDGVYINTQTSGGHKIGPNNTFTANYDARDGVTIVTGDTVEVFLNTFTTITKNGMPGHVSIQAGAPTDTLAHVDVHDNTLIGGATAGTGTLAGISIGGQNGGNDIKIRNNDISGTRLNAGVVIVGTNGGPSSTMTPIVVSGNNIHNMLAGGNGVEFDWWISADIINNTFNGMDKAIYSFQACPGLTTGNTYIGVTTNYRSDDPKCPTSNVFTVPGSIDATGVTDVTAALQSWINGVPNGTTTTPNILRFAGGTYRVHTMLTVSSRQNLIFDSTSAVLGGNTTLQHTTPVTFSSPSYFGNDSLRLIRFADCQNITLRYLKFLGASPMPASGDGFVPWEANVQHIHNIAVSRCTNFNIQYCKVDASGGGDGINWGNENVGTRSSGVIEDCEIKNAHRCGIAVVGSDGLTIRRNTFATIGFWWIDLEPNTVESGNLNTLIESNIFNSGAPLSPVRCAIGAFAGSKDGAGHCDNLTIRNNTFNRTAEIRFNTDINAAYPYPLRPFNIRIEGNVATVNGPQIECRQIDTLNVSGNTFGPITDPEIGLWVCTDVHIAGSTSQVFA